MLPRRVQLRGETAFLPTDGTRGTHWKSSTDRVREHRDFLQSRQVCGTGRFEERIDSSSRNSLRKTPAGAVCLGIAFSTSDRWNKISGIGVGKSGHRKDEKNLSGENTYITSVVRWVVVIANVGVLLDHFADEVEVLSVAPTGNASQFLSWNKNSPLYDLSNATTSRYRGRGPRPGPGFGAERHEFRDSMYVLPSITVHKKRLRIAPPLTA